MKTVRHRIATFAAAFLPAAALLWMLVPALAQVGGGAPIAYLYCYLGTGAVTSPTSYTPCQASNPLAVSGTFTPSGTQNVNLTQILGAAPSLTNPLWVFPATGATFPVSFAGNVTVIGPTADGSPASTAPVLIGGTVDGSASGNVGVAKVDAAGLAYNAVTNWGGGALGAMANYGTSPGAVLVPGVNAFITNSVTVTGTVAATQSGIWTVQPGNTPNTTPWLTTNTPSAASGAGLTPVSSSALAANTVIKASAGNLYSFEVSADSTLSGAAWWIMIYNATSAPVDGAVTPLKCYAMASGTTSYGAAFPTPAAFSTGITIGVSTTGCFTKTASTHAFISGDAQ